MTDLEPRRAAAVYRNPFVWAFVIGIVTLTALRPLMRHIPEPPPVVGDVPAFTLIDQDGRRFGRDDLLGRVTIANFFCTRCGPASADAMKGLHRIEDAYKDRGIDRIGVLSVSTDPIADTPERLRDYARAIGAEAGRWTFITGDPALVHGLAVALFENAPATSEADGTRPDGPALRTAVQGPGESNTTKPLVLIDQRARIRGWYAVDEMGLDEVYNRAQHVLAQSDGTR